MVDSLQFDASGETAAQAATAVLTRQGLRVVRSFDLRTALAAHADCPCPYHGAAQCTCQFMVLLVYGEADEPVVVTAHSYDNRTNMLIVRDATTIPDPRLAEEVMTALAEAAQEKELS